ncbi:MAG: hypothetical protein P1Q69_07115 [Candidatus Thorarchaeota archaeon]|nr:hypothetical protein [Candidatus Thorarchaeota archaeon]
MSLSEELVIVLYGKQMFDYADDMNVLGTVLTNDFFHSLYIGRFSHRREGNQVGF